MRNRHHCVLKRSPPRVPQQRPLWLTEGLWSVWSISESDKSGSSGHTHTLLEAKSIWHLPPAEFFLVVYSVRVYACVSACVWPCDTPSSLFLTPFQLDRITGLLSPHRWAHRLCTNHGLSLSYLRAHTCTNAQTQTIHTHANTRGRSDPSLCSSAAFACVPNDSA